MLVFEGVDAVGKSTLEQKIQQKIHYPIIKGSSFELAKCSNEKLFNHFKNITLSSKSVIIDRWAISNYIYAGHYFDYARISEQQLNYLLSLLEAQDATLIYVHADIEVIKHRLHKRGDKYIKENDIQQIYDDYNNFFYKKYKKFLRYIDVDTSNDNIEELTDYILRFV